MGEATLFSVQFTGSKLDLEDVRLSDFVDELKEIRHVFLEIDRRVSKRRKPQVDFRIEDLSHMSPATISLRAVPIGEGPDFSAEITDRFFEGLQALIRGDIPHDADTELLERYAGITKGLGRSGLQAISFKRGSFVARIHRSFTGKISDLLEMVRFDSGSVEGMLDAINLHEKANRLALYPIVGPARVVCHFSGELAEQAIRGLGKYVSVQGTLEFRGQDRFPRSIQVFEIEVFPDEEGLPTIHDLRGIAPDATGDVPSEVFVRNLRG